MKFKRFISVLLALTVIFSLNIVSLSQPVLRDIFSSAVFANALEMDDLITKYMPEGTRNLALDAFPTASSYLTSANGQWHIDRVNDGTMRYVSDDGLYNGPAGYTSSTDEVKFDASLTPEEKETQQQATQNLEWWMVFDLEGFYDISRVAMFRYGAYPNDFTIQVSDDGVNYTTVSTQTGQANAVGEAGVYDVAAKARFVKIHVTKRGDLQGNPIYVVQFGEIAIFGTEVEPTNVATEINSYAPVNCINLAPESNVTSNDVETHDQWALENINDGNPAQGTGYTSSPNNTYPLHIDYNLGKIAEVKRLVFFPYGEFPKSFEVQTSFDGVNFKTVATKDGFINYPNTNIVVDLPEMTFASYVRINVTERNYAGWDNSKYYVQFAEIGIYGVKNIFDNEFSKTSINLKPNDEIQLEWSYEREKTFLPYTHEIEWTSLDPSIAEVTADGVVTGKAEGTTQIRVTNTVLGYSVFADVSVSDDVPYARDKMAISIFSPPADDLFTDEQYQLIADADVDLLLNSFNIRSKEDNFKLLDMARKYGMNVIACDTRFEEHPEAVTKEQAEAVYEDFKGISNLEGIYLRDEPWNGNEYAESVNNLKDVFGDGFVYLNYFPGYIYNSYQQYEYTFDDIAALTDSRADLMMDVYPFMYDGTTTYDRLFNCLNAMRRSGLKYGINTAACIQTLGFGPISAETLSTRVPEEADIMYQNMASLAYGVKHVSYWKWSSTGNSTTERFTDCAVDAEGNPTDVYYHIKRANPVVHTLGETLYNCDAKEVYIVGSNLYGQETTPANFFVHSADSTKSLIFSYMKDKNTGRNYLMVVNNDLANTVTAPLTFASEIKNIEILNNSTGEWSGASVSGNYNVTLEPGCAALIALPESYRYGEVNNESAQNVALGKTVYGDSSIGTPGTRDEKRAGYYLSCLTDGYTSANAALGLNGWCSELKSASYNTYVKVDLGAEKNLSRLTLYAVDSSTGYTGFFPKAYTVQVSANGNDWTSVASETNASVTTSVTYEFAEISARYIKVEITEMNSVNGEYAAAMSEIELNGNPKIVRYKAVAEDTNGFYMYTYAQNSDSVRMPTWTDYNGRDDIIWHDAEKGNWTINGFTYNFRAYIPASQHNNEHGKYTVHIYGYNDGAETSNAASFTYALNVGFDLNYGNASQNLMCGLGLIVDGSGLTVSYDETDDTLTLNGTLTGSFVMQPNMPINANAKKGDILRVTIEEVSGTNSNGVIVMEIYNDAMQYPDGRRHNADMTGAGVKDITLITDAAAKEASNYRFWIYKNSDVQTFTNYKFRIKLEIVGESEVYSPSGKSIVYGESYGALPQPTRDDADFLGWFTAPTGGTQVTTASVNNTVGNQMLYAHWAEMPYELCYGLYAGITAEVLERDYLQHENVTYKYTYVNDKPILGSGTLVDVTDNTTNKLTARYALVIFGDINSDGWYDGQDAVLTEAFVTGMITADYLGEARVAAADCNHDGYVDVGDIKLLRNAGLLRAQVDQTLPAEEMFETAAWAEYSELIDQNPDEPEEDKLFIVKVWEFIVNLFKKIFSFIFK